MQKQIIITAALPLIRLGELPKVGIQLRLVDGTLLGFTSNGDFSETEANRIAASIREDA